MNINLLPYQEKSVDQLISKIKGLLHSQEDGKICVFQAPTGSGKTVIVAKFIEEIIKELPKIDLCFLWVSIGKGNLHIQSRIALKKIFGGFPRCVLVDEEFTGGRERIVRNEVVVVNWEKLRSQDHDTGDWLNILMKDGEKINFREVLRKTREQRKIILIIDESHVGKGSQRTVELISEVFLPNVSLEMSATPDKETIPSRQDEEEGRGAYVYVKPSDVIEQGMIKKEIIINENIDEIGNNEQDSQEVILEAAYKKRLALAKYFKEMGVNINPLVLVQLPNAEAGEVKIQAAKEFLASKHITEETGELEIWLQGDRPENTDELSIPDNKIEFLIFKQAIDTGWDCPRAHILVKFRETHSETFEIQTVGRIMRMPEQKHYIIEDLNRGYIFTNVQSIIVKKEEYNPNIIKHLRSIRKACYREIKLKSFYKTRADYGDITASFYQTFEKVACIRLPVVANVALYDENIKNLERAGYIFNPKNFSQDIIADTRVDSKKLDELVGEIKPDKSVRLTLSDNDLYDMFNQVIKDNIGSFAPKRSVSPVRESIYKWFRKFLGSKEWDEEIIVIQRIFLHERNRKAFEEILCGAVERYRVVKEAEVRAKIVENLDDFEILPEYFFNQHADEKFESKACLYNPCYLSIDRSTPEKEFENLLEENSKNIIWWWKNGENKRDYFGIRYEYEGGVHTFYPDYLVHFFNNKLGIFEVKDSNDQDGITWTKAKAEALQKYIKDQKKSENTLLGGIVIKKRDGWKINSKLNYDWSKCVRGDWSDWDDFRLLKK